MKAYSEEGLAALADGTAISAGAVEIYCDPPFYCWGGDGTLEMDGKSFLGLGAHALVEVGGGSLGGAAQNITLTLSGVAPEIIDMIDVAALRSAPVVIWELTFDGSGQTLLDAHVFSRGQCDRMPRTDQPAGPSSIKIMVETAANGLGRRGARMRSDADQRMVSPTDGGCKHVSYAGEITLYWGGKMPSTASSAFGIAPSRFSPKPGIF